MSAEAGNQGAHGPAQGLGIGKWIVVGLVGLGLMGGLAWAGTRNVAKLVNPAAAYLAEQAKRPGAQTTASGLIIEVVRPGTGPKPTNTDLVLVNYEGKLADGTVFDSSYQRRQPAAFPVAGVIPGFSEGLQQMQKGGKYRLVIPPAIGYGDRTDTPFPPNSVLVFDVELLDIAPAQAAAG